MTAADLLGSATTEAQCRILGCLMAYAAGDAFGGAYEFLAEPIPVDVGRIGSRADWPLGGGVSDDTDLSLITIFAARPGDPEGSAGQFIHDLRAELPRLRGLGPSTRAALGLEPGSADGFAIVGPTVIGNTNGGVMRTALLGLGFSSGDDARRRALVSAMASVTHPAKPATQCAVLASALHARADPLFSPCASDESAQT